MRYRFHSFSYTCRIDMYLCAVEVPNLLELFVSHVMRALYVCLLWRFLFVLCSNPLYIGRLVGLISYLAYCVYLLHYTDRLTRSIFDRKCNIRKNVFPKTTQNRKVLLPFARRQKEQHNRSKCNENGGDASGTTCNSIWLHRLDVQRRRTNIINVWNAAKATLKIYEWKCGAN